MIERCLTHPDLDAAGNCNRCQRPYCDNCLVEFLGQRYCGPCRDQKLFELQASTTPGTTGRLAGTNTVDIGGWISRGWSMVNANLGAWVVATLITIALTLVTCGLGGPAMTCGLYMLAFRQMTGGRIEGGGVTDGFRRFLHALIWSIAAGFATFVASLILQIPSIIVRLSMSSSSDPGAIGIMLLASVWDFVVSTALSLFVGGLTLLSLPHIAARNADPAETLRVSWGIFRRNWVMWAVFSLVIQLIASIGVIACCVGILFTVPLGVCATACAYADHFGLDGWESA